MDLHLNTDQGLVHSFSQAKLVGSNSFREVMSYLKVLFADPDQSVIPGKAITKASEKKLFKRGREEESKRTFS